MFRKSALSLALVCATVSAPAVLFAQTASMGQTMPAGQSATSDQDKQFVQTAAQSDFTEITFSKLAADKGSSPGVKSFAQKMITDHQMLTQKMQPFAQQMGVNPPTALDSAHQQTYDQLNQQSGPEFDKQYMNAMSQDHHTALDAFKSESGSTQDAKLKTVVKGGEKVVARHTMMADKMVKKMGGSAPASM